MDKKEPLPIDNTGTGKLGSIRVTLYKCRGCKKETDNKYELERCDAYGIYTGLYCDKCYDDPQKYTYKKDRYFDPAYAGERLEEEE